MSITLNRAGFSSQKSKLQARFQKALAENRDEFLQNLKQVAAETAEELGARTFPSSLAIGITMNSVRHDVSRVYALPGGVYEILKEKSPAAAGAFWAAMKKNDLSSARRIVRESGTSVSNIVIGVALDPSHHESARDSKTGNVSLKVPRQMVIKTERDSYMKHVLRKIGKTASGWYAAAKDLGGNGNVIRWKGTSIHGSGGGNAQIQISKTGVSVLLVNSQPLAKKHLSPSQVSQIMNRSTQKLLSTLKRKSSAA